ncbi:MAG: Co2+/Mg2+ efflux protein ApaG [Bdellovibrionales bacterium]|nr:Co2+/Mg2+ efflux protein ApaG [Bdellovibrionales bacterium]
MTTYTETTENFLVEVKPSYVPEHSEPEESKYFFSYNIKITNLGDKPAQLLRRHWVIMDGRQHREDVEGPGVIGETPFFEPGASFEYTSFCPLPTPTGSMRGSYLMTKPDGETFKIRVPLFFLRDFSHDQ